MTNKSTSDSSALVNLGEMFNKLGDIFRAMADDVGACPREEQAEEIMTLLRQLARLESAKKPIRDLVLLLLDTYDINVINVDLDGVSMQIKKTSRRS